MSPQISSRAFVSLQFVIFIAFSTFQCCGVISAVKQNCNNSGVDIVAESSLHREEKIATVIATRDLNKVLQKKINLVPYVNDSSVKLLQASMAAETAKPMVIGLPVKRAFKEFVVCGENGETPTGYCIDVFNEAIKYFRHNILSYKFVCYNGTYSELVEQVYHKKYDAAVGDITIMYNRSKYVDFTQPYMESSLTMISPVKVEKLMWLFIKPFTATAWLLIFGGFLYTMVVVWILERRSNPDFKGTRVNQLSTALWFTFSTLFFAHRESIRSNYTRGVMLVWFCAVFVVATSYQASLTTMLTLQHLKPTVTNIKQLKSSNAIVGCDSNAFYRNYVVGALGFRPENIINMTSNEDYINALKNGTISAVFLEVPYARILLSEYGKDYKDSGAQKDRFGGFGFAFPKGSSLAVNFSNAFLALSEDGTLKKLDKKWFPPNSVDSNSDSNIEEQRLDYDNFTGLFLVTGSTSTVILVFYCIFCFLRDPPVNPAHTGELHEASDEPHPFRSRNVNHVMSLDTESLSEFYTRGREIQMQEIYAGDPDNQTRQLRVAMSFPGPHRRTSAVNSAVLPRQPIAQRTSV